MGRWRTIAVAGAALGRGTASVLLPEACVACGRPGTPLCRACLAARPRVAPSACPDCSGPLGAGALTACDFCRRSPLLGVVAGAPYVDPWRRWLRRTKFGPQPALVRPLAGVLAAELAALDPNPGWLLVPMPPTSRASVLRGPVLSEALACQVSARLGLPCAPLLAVGRPRRSQRRRSRRERGHLDAEVFEVAPPTWWPRVVVLVDDVMTTGATLAAAGWALRRAGVRAPLLGAVLARAGAPVLT